MLGNGEWGVNTLFPIRFRFHYSFDPFESQHKFLLMPQFVDAKVFEIFPRQFGDTIDGSVTLLNER